MIIGMMRKIFFIRAAGAPIELLLRRSRWLSGPFIVLLTNQQAFAPLREIKIFKPLKLLYG
jgi:hypothetical protein